MAKTIKFNLILDNYPVRNIEGLQEHFSIEDMLKYFENGLLLRWLDVRGYQEQYLAVKAIDHSLDYKEIIIALIKIFEVSDLAVSDIEKAVGILSYLEEERELNEIYRENAFAKKQIIEDYHSGYCALIMHMQDNNENMSILKADAIQMEREYLGLFKLDYDALYFRLLKSAPKAIFAMLTRDAFRQFWIGNDADNSKIKTSVKNDLIAKAGKILGDDLKIVRRNTQAMWDPIERPEVPVMVISMATGTFVKNAGAFYEKYSSLDVNNKLPKFNGLEYQCNDADLSLLYMEV